MNKTERGDRLVARSGLSNVMLDATVRLINVFRSQLPSLNLDTLLSHLELEPLMVTDQTSRNE